MDIVIVDQEKCPRCGGGAEFGNRTKVGHEDGTWSWRCYNPNCDLRYYNPSTGDTEDEPTPEEEERIKAESKRFVDSLTSIEVTTVTSEGTTTEIVNLREEE